MCCKFKLLHNYSVAASQGTVISFEQSTAQLSSHVPQEDKQDLLFQTPHDHDAGATASTEEESAAIRSDKASLYATGSYA